LKLQRFRLSFELNFTMHKSVRKNDLKCDDFKLRSATGYDVPTVDASEQPWVAFPIVEKELYI